MGRLLLRKSKEDGFFPHEGLFVRIMNHQGLTSLRLLLPGGMEALGEEIAKIREQVYKLKASDIDNRMRYREYKYMGVLGRHTLFTDVVRWDVPDVHGSRPLTLCLSALFRRSGWRSLNCFIAIKALFLPLHSTNHAACFV